MVAYIDGRKISMSQENKTKAELLKEIEALQQHVAELEETASHENEQHYRLLAEAAFEGIVFSERGVFVDVNKQFTEMFDYQHEELIGTEIIQLIAPQSRKKVTNMIRNNRIEPYEFVGLRKDGSTIYAEARTRTAVVNGGQLRATAIRDITQQKIIENALRLSESKFSQAFYTSPDSININRLEDGLYIEINQGFTDITGYISEEVLGKTSLELDIWADPADRERLVQGLRENGEVSNLEAVFRKKNGEFLIGLMSARILEINSEICLLSVTRDITERKKTAQQIRILNEELLAAYDQTLAGWSRALNLRDANTDSHSQRVVETTTALALAAGIPEEHLVHVRRGTILHDIGKMGVPDQILHKPGPLTDIEWGIMRQHPIFAYEMLSKIPFLRQALDIPYYHHEHWDGSGYPNGLQGEEIPLAARVFSVIDVFDALTADRTYRQAWQREDACAYIKDNAGTHFDPDIAQLFLEME